MLHEPAPGGIEADYVCLTDGESDLLVAPNSVWSVRICEPGLGRAQKLFAAHKRLCNNSVVQALPSEFFERGSYDIVIKVDANVSLSDNSLLGEMVHAGTQCFAEVVYSVHPDRDCIYQEANASFYPKYANNDFESQMKAYRDLGCPEHVGLYWTGLVVYLDPFGERTIAFGQRFLDEVFNCQWAKNPVEMWHPQGQIILSKLLFDMGALPANDRKVDASIRVADFPAVYGIRCQAYRHGIRP